MNRMTRREFVRRTSIVSGAAAMSFPFVGRVLGANERINVACIGVGGKGDSDSSDAQACGGNIVAICDVDRTTLDRKGKQFPQAKRYQDFRKLLDEMGKEIDAVTVSTPDHTHGVAAIRAMKMGKHCFCQKPLVQTVHEARTLRQLAAEKKLATQMGNQGSAESGLRRAVEVVQAGVIGKPLELHVWSNRPVWPQGLERPAGSDPVPETLDWDAWLGPAQSRPFKRDVYHTFKWRGWFDFGTGALGDMACHTVNMPFRALKLGYPTAVECELASRLYPETFPKTSRIRFEFPERDGLPPLKFWWYDGNPGDALKPLRPGADVTREIVATMGNLPESGALIIGEKGKLFSPDDYGARFFVAMKGQDEFVPGDRHEACKAVPQTIPRSPGHMQEWFRMMREGVPAYSNFDIAAYLTEIILLGCIALRVGEGIKMEWDGPNMRSTNLPQAERFVRRNNRPGWEA
ncbi:MAG TPA: Gfo/Idh/MocA family oxidoreductase [Verrucomicrobiota bacterium]|nr:Gfo/Idh/MocA family oxidoreductase [Verrucomicrobiota bacterium]HRT08123.1 Gfo/Idh/MocA family oxidoreductase [Candidatus Paceibacterota bacterium]HRT55839.1 Gfo/Idh/MocA family oxidoreductase [Candidatus Paceibacterota bacterium]